VDSKIRIPYLSLTSRSERFWSPLASHVADTKDGPLSPRSLCAFIAWYRATGCGAGKRFYQHSLWISVQGNHVFSDVANHLQVSRCLLHKRETVRGAQFKQDILMECMQPIFSFTRDCKHGARDRKSAFDIAVYTSGTFYLDIQKYATGFILSARNEIAAIATYASYINRFIQAFIWIQVSELCGILNYRKYICKNKCFYRRSKYRIIFSGCYSVYSGSLPIFWR
jgi:hypothetical protein